MELYITVLTILACWGMPTTNGLEADLLLVMEQNATYQDQWVDAHNYYRRQVSDPEAADMRLITWDDELAQLADTAVRKCNFSHTPEEDRNTSVFAVTGENIYAGNELSFVEMMTREGVTKKWYDEVSDYNYTTRSCAPTKVCGHYTQVVWAETYKIGCAIAQCSAIENGVGDHLVICAYGPTGNVHFNNEPLSPYANGSACSQCDTDDTCVDQLCNNTARDIGVTQPTPFPVLFTHASLTTSSGNNIRVRPVWLCVLLVAYYVFYLV